MAAASAVYADAVFRRFQKPVNLTCVRCSVTATKGRSFRTQVQLLRQLGCHRRQPSRRGVHKPRGTAGGGCCGTRAAESPRGAQLLSGMSVGAGHLCGITGYVCLHTVPAADPLRAIGGVQALLSGQQVSLLHALVWHLVLCSRILLWRQRNASRWHREADEFLGTGFLLHGLCCTEHLLDHVADAVSFRAERGDGQLQQRVLGLAPLGARDRLDGAARRQPAARLHRRALLVIWTKLPVATAFMMHSASAAR